VFEFSTTSRIVFGTGALEKMPEIVRGFGRRVFLVTGANVSRSSVALARLENQGSIVEVYRIKREPTVEDVQRGIERSRAFGSEVVVGIGGGSALDAAKAIAALTTDSGELLDYLEVVGRGFALTGQGLPCVAMPTTSGTGAEVTRNAVIDVPEQSTKVSLRGAKVLPRVAIVDPQLTVSMASQVTAATGFDALTQVIEPFLSVRANPMTDALSREGIRLAARSLLRAYSNGADVAAREDMAMVSLLGGLSLANAGLGAVHGLAGPLGGLFRAPHGAVCAALLSATLTVNLKCVRARGGAEGVELLERFREVARLLTSQNDATAEDGIAWIERHTQLLRIPKLSSYGVGPERFGHIIERALRASSMQYNCIRLTPEDLSWVLRSSL
jgi:alcohol dehydrogenase class IV